MPTESREHVQPHRKHVTNVPFPVTGHLPVHLKEDARERAARLARTMLQSDPRLTATSAFGEEVFAGCKPGPCLLIEDHYAIRLFESFGNQAYSYRTLLLARPGDVVVIGGSRSPAFEHYCSEVLGLGPVEILEPAASARIESLASRCARDSVVMEKLAARAREQGGLSIVPYMGSGGVWALAGALAARADTPVHVCAPPPRLTRSTNDKIWFSECVDRLIGRQARPAAWPVWNSAMLAAGVAKLARDHASLVIKLPDSASSKGNLLLDAARFAGRPLGELRQDLVALMRGAGWHDGLPVLLSAWEHPVLVSPSAHLWIPQTGSDDPVVEAVFEQTLAGTGRAFAGAVPTTLPVHWQQRLVDESAQLGLLFQRLGYVGRCSFDAILVGSNLDGAVLHWIECNGRWGGVSLPLTLAARLFGDWQKRPFVIVERSGLCGSSHDFSEIIAALEDELFTADGRQAGAVILSPAPLEMGSGYEIMVFDDDVDGANRRATRIDAILKRIL
jgi:hypothetical protein